MVAINNVEVDKAFIEKLEAVRQERNVPRRILAELLRVHPNSYNELARGARKYIRKKTYERALKFLQGDLHPPPASSEAASDVMEAVTLKEDLQKLREELGMSWATLSLSLHLKRESLRNFIHNKSYSRAQITRIRKAVEDFLARPEELIKEGHLEDRRPKPPPPTPPAPSPGTFSVELPSDIELDLRELGLIHRELELIQRIRAHRSRPAEASKRAG